jgi:hypothetical protein
MHAGAPSYSIDTSCACVYLVHDATRHAMQSLAPDAATAAAYAELTMKLFE